jgi:hypothetical protein
MIYKFKTSEALGGRLVPQHPLVDAGMSADGRVSTYAITDIPSGVSVAEVLRLADATSFLPGIFTATFAQIGIGKIVRA